MHPADRDFDAEAADWDQSALRVRVAESVGACIIRDAGLHPAMRVLDCGCGTGLVTLRLAPHVGPVLALDSSAGMVAVFERKLREAAHPNVCVRCGGIELLPEGDTGFDLAVCTQTLTHVADPGRVLSLLCRRVRPGGRLAIAEMDLGGVAGPSMGFDRRALRTLVETCGASVESVSDAVTIPAQATDGTTFEKRYYVLVARRPTATAG